MTRVLLVVSGSNVWTLKDGTKHPTGFWASEFIHPHQVFTAAGYDITIATPGGVAPTVDEVSLRPDLNGDDQSAVDAQRAYLADLGVALTKPARLEDVNPQDYDAVYVSGGHGPMEDLADNPVIGEIYAAIAPDENKVAAAVCHGVGALLPARTPDGTWLFAGKRMTGFTDEEETAFGFGDKAPWLLETRLRQNGADFDGGPAFGPQVVIDGNLITGQNPASAQPSAKALVNYLTAHAQAHTTALITGASYGLGAVYADRLARQGHDLVLVARSRDDLERVATEIREQTGRRVDVIVADLAVNDQLARVERRIREDDSISVLVNNAGIGRLGRLADADPDVIEAMLALNVSALTRLAGAAARQFTSRSRGTIINVSSAMALRLPAGSAAYAATKSYVLGFSQALAAELKDSGVTVQAVLPGATRSRFWDQSGLDLDTFPEGIVMSSEDAVDAALAGLQAGETVSILALPDQADWDDYETARLKLAAQSSNKVPAARYGVVPSLA